VHKDVAGEVSAIFRDLYRGGFQIERMTAIEEIQGDDDASMAQIIRRASIARCDG